MSAFGGLLMKRPVEGEQDKAPTAPAGGGGDAAAGDAASAAAARLAREKVLVPPQPSPPTRLPRKAPSVSCSSSSSCSPPGTPATLSPESLRPPLKLASSSRHVTASLSNPENEAWWGLPASEEEALRLREQTAKELEQMYQAKKARASDADKDGNFCCFREGRMPRNTCESIKEDRPQTKFDFDVMVLELRSLLRSHQIEPSNTLVGDLLVWQARAAERTVGSGRPPLMLQGNRR